VTPRRRTGGGSGSSSHGGGDSSSPDTPRRPPGTGGDGIELDADRIDTMAGRLDATAVKVDTLGTTVGGIDVGPQSMGVIGGNFTGAAKDHLRITQEHVKKTQQAVTNAQAGTRRTAEGYRTTEADTVANFGRIDDDTDVPTTTTPATTTPAGTNQPPAPSQHPDSTRPQSISDRLDGDDNGGGGNDGPPPPSRRHPDDGDDDPRTQPDRRNPPPTLDAGGQSLGRFGGDRVTRDRTTGRITHVDGVPVREKLRQIAQERAREYHDAKVRKDDGLSGGRTGNIVAHVMDTRTGEVFETTNGPKGSQIDPADVHPELQRRVDELREQGPYPDFDRDGNPTGDPHRPYPGYDLPLRHAEVRGANDALHANPSATMDDLIADTTFLRKDGLADAPFCANCSGILRGDVPSNSQRLEYDPRTGKIEKRPY
jgi:hypothetical protein